MLGVLSPASNMEAHHTEAHIHEVRHKLLKVSKYVQYVRCAQALGWRQRHSFLEVSHFGIRSAFKSRKKMRLGEAQPELFNQR